MTRSPTWNEPRSCKRMGSLPGAKAEPVARPSENTLSKARPKRRMAPSLLLLKTELCDRRTRSLGQALPDHPCLDDVGDLGIVLVLHQHVRISLDADVGEVDHVDGAAAGAYRGGIFEIDLLVRRPAGMLVDIVAEQHQRRRVLQHRRLADVASACRLDRNDRLDLGPAAAPRP